MSGLLGALVFAGGGALLSGESIWWPLWGAFVYFCVYAVIGLYRWRRRPTGLDRPQGR